MPIKKKNPPVPRSFRVDARALISLGRESIKDHATALIELVKNSYDADAENVEVEIVRLHNRIRIADDGVGMTSEDINERWLRIGFSAKRKKRFSSKGRRETGEKGIGRLSSDRLGSLLDLRTKTATSSPVGVHINWDDFDVDGADLAAVPISDIAKPVPTISKRTVKSSKDCGTEIIIGGLRQTWSDEDIRALETELATLVPAEAAKNPFKIWLRVDEKGKFRRMESAFDGQAELVFLGEIDGNGLLTYNVTGRPSKVNGPRASIAKGTVAWEQLTSSKSRFGLGPITVRLSFFLRSAVALSGGLTLGKLREYLDSEGGVRIYRDGVRVKPYGDPNHPEGDWLSLAKRKTLNPAGAGRSDFRMSANQLVGAVLISRDTNAKLTDSAAREGLVHSDAYALLKTAVFGCVGLLESIYHRQYLDRKTATEIDPAQLQLPLYVAEIKSTLSALSKDLTEATRFPNTAESAQLFHASAERLQVVVEQFAEAERQIEELASQNTVYRGLATVGISAAVFGHETESSLAQAKLSATVARKMLTARTPSLEGAVEEIEKAEKAIARIELWGQFAISRVKKDKRKRGTVDISRTVSSLIAEIRPLFAASRIELTESISPGIEVKAFAMDIESLFLNLLTNAFHAASLSTRNRKVSISMHVVGRALKRRASLVVCDSGPGIAREHLPLIWEPLFSTKVDTKGRPIGTGLGLAIVKSIATEMGATATALPKGALGGAQFDVEFLLK